MTYENLIRAMKKSGFLDVAPMLVNHMTPEEQVQAGDEFLKSTLSRSVPNLVPVAILANHADKWAAFVAYYASIFFPVRSRTRSIRIIKPDGSEEEMPVLTAPVFDLFLRAVTGSRVRNLEEAKKLINDI